MAMAGDVPFSDYIIFVDESGAHNLRVVNSVYPLFVLAFCLVRKDEYVSKIVPAVQKLKFATFGHDMAVLHSRDIRKQRGEFAILRDAGRRNVFLTEITKIMAEAPFTLTVSAIDKCRHVAKHDTPCDPYHLSLRFCLERAHRFLVDKGQAGRLTHVVAESRGKVEDEDLKKEFRRIVRENGHWKHGFKLFFAPKSCNSTGLQLADLVAHPVGRHVLKPNQPNRAFDIVERKLMTDGLDGKDAFAALTRPTHRRKGYEGIGLKVFP